MNVVAWAESAKHFEQRVTEIAKEQLDCVVGELEQVELLEVALLREGCPDEFFTSEPQPNANPMTCYSGLFTFGLKTMSINVSGPPEKEPQGIVTTSYTVYSRYLHTA